MIWQFRDRKEKEARCYSKTNRKGLEMRKCAIIFMTSSVLIWAAGCVSVKTSTKDKQVEKKVKKLLAKMTLEEKVGQMTQVTLEVVAGQTAEDGSLKLDNKKLQDAIVKHQVGSILNCGGQARSVDNWQEIITQIQAMATKKTRLGIPIIYGIDAIHGANYTLGATIFPQHIAMAATGNGCGHRECPGTSTRYLDSAEIRCGRGSGRRSGRMHISTRSWGRRMSKGCRAMTYRSPRRWRPA